MTTTATTATVLSGADFVRDLKAELRKPGRYLPEHPWVQAVNTGKATRKQLQFWATQYFCAIRFGQLMSAITFANCPDPAIRKKIIEVLAEEELGILSKSAPHKELFIRFALGTGLSREQMENAKPAYAAAVHVHHMEFVGKLRPFFYRRACSGIGVEWQVPKTFGLISQGLKKHYGLTPEQTFFFDMHKEADEEHGDVSSDIVSKYATTQEVQEDLKHAVIQHVERFWALWASALEV